MSGAIEITDVLDWLRDTAERFPTSIAIDDLDHALTYRAYDQLSNGLAVRLVELGVQPGDRIGLAVSKGWAAYVAIYAILKAGAAFVPLALDDPPARTQIKLDRCGISLILVDAQPHSNLDGLKGDLVFYSATSATACPDRPMIARANTSTCYIYHTSGSTGVPKSVAISDRALESLVNPFPEYVLTSQNSRIASTAPLHFDMSALDMFHAVQTGATLVPVPAKVLQFPYSLLEFLDDKRISHWFTVPSLLCRLMDVCEIDAREVLSIQNLLFGGEPIFSSYLKLLPTIFPNATFHHLYGTTETTIVNTIHSGRSFEGEHLPIGDALPGSILEVRDEAAELVSAGSTGTLYIGGRQVLEGYWGDPEMTSERMVVDGDTGVRWYRTGDLVEVAPDGHLYFRGRADNMVKLNGYLIELGEIENCLMQIPEISQAHALVVTDQNRSPRLAAVVKTKVNASTTVEELGTQCRTRLPQYMIPRQLKIVTQIPITSSGKVDQDSLRRLFSE